MKSGIHPQWHHDCVVTCACGNSFVTGSTAPTLQIDICNKCHPFFTGELKFVDRQGRVDRFMQKMAVAQARQTASQAKNQQKQVQKQKAAAKSAETPRSYRDILREQQGSLRQQKSAATADAK